jgi:transcriptional regulator with XRE-family HTH domain
METLRSDEYKTLVEKLIEARQKAGLTQNEVAAKLQKPQSYISKIENRQRRIDALELKKLANLYKADIAELI